MADMRSEKIKIAHNLRNKTKKHKGRLSVCVHMRLKYVKISFQNSQE